MRDIELKLDKAELKLLLKLVYTGYCVVDNDDCKYSEEIEKLIDRILQLVETYKANKGIGYNKIENRYFLEADTEDELLEEYNDFIEETFWDELVHRLGQRDVIEEIGEKAYKNLGIKEKIDKEYKAEEKYDKEFEKNGYINLKIVKEKEKIV